MQFSALFCRSSQISMKYSKSFVYLQIERLKTLTFDFLSKNYL